MRGWFPFDVLLSESRVRPVAGGVVGGVGAGVIEVAGGGTGGVGADDEVAIPLSSRRLSLRVAPSVRLRVGFAGGGAFPDVALTTDVAGGGN